MNTKLFITAVILWLFYGCSANDIADTRTKEENLSAKELVENNIFIDIPEYPAIGKYGSGTALDNKSRAANYRFIKHLKLENGKFSCDLNSGIEINISQDLFEKLMKDHVIDMNKWIDEVHSRGNKALVFKTNDKYLECLLNGEICYGGDEQIEL